jgi:hypothetical protein
MNEIIERVEDRVRIDANLVEPGTYIDPEALEEAIGENRHSSTYSFEVLRLREKLESDLEADGRALMTKGEGHGIRVMTPDEATEYADRRFWLSLRVARKVHQRCAAVVQVATLSPDVKDRHERQADARVRVLQSIEGATKQPLNGSGGLPKLSDGGSKT